MCLRHLSFANNGYTASVDTKNCYYGECAVTTNVGSATAKTSEEFTNGTVAKLLGEAFAQGKLYPVFATDPADYTKVDAAIAQVNTLNKDNYKDFSAVEAAVNAVDRDKKIAEQPAVDAMAEAIEHAIADLQYKDADYTKVDAAIAKANALKKNDYKDFSAVEGAVNAVARGKNITEQTEVDAMAKSYRRCHRSAGQKAFLRWQFFFRRFLFPELSRDHTRQNGERYRDCQPAFCGKGQFCDHHC